MKPATLAFFVIAISITQMQVYTNLCICVCENLRGIMCEIPYNIILIDLTFISISQCHVFLSAKCLRDQIMANIAETKARIEANQARMKADIEEQLRKHRETMKVAFAQSTPNETMECTGNNAFSREVDLKNGTRRITICRSFYRKSNIVNNEPLTTIFDQDKILMIQLPGQPATPAPLVDVNAEKPTYDCVPFTKCSYDINVNGSYFDMIIFNSNPDSDSDSDSNSYSDSNSN